MSLRGEMIAVLGAMYDTPLEPGTQLSINSNALDALTIATELNMFPAQSEPPLHPGAELVVHGQSTEWQSAEDFHATVRMLLATDTAGVVNIPARGV